MGSNLDFDVGMVDMDLNIQNLDSDRVEQGTRQAKRKA
jgi:hypothetical protein